MHYKDSQTTEEASQFEFTSAQESAYVPRQQFVSAEGYFLYGRHAGEHIASVPGDYLAASIASQLGRAILMQAELNRRHSREIVDRLLAEPDPQESDDILSDYVHQQ
jgi:hypothetical protein